MIFSKKQHQHKIVVTYTSGEERVKYEGIDDRKAEELYVKYKEHQNIVVCEWLRDGKQYKTF